MKVRNSGDPCTGTATAQTVDGDHGRIETRTATISHGIEWLQRQHDWPGLVAIGKVDRTREEADKTTHETAYLGPTFLPLRIRQPECPRKLRASTAALDLWC